METSKMNTYIELHELVLNYKHGDTKAAAAIESRYKGYLLSYVKLLLNGYCGINDDAPIRNFYRFKKFIVLFIPNINKYANSHNCRFLAKETILGKIAFINTLFQQYSSVELYNELLVALLNMAKKYSDYEKPSFHTYVSRCFHFEAYRQLSKFTKDPVASLYREEYIDEQLVEPLYIEDKTDFIDNELDKALMLKYSPTLTIKDEASVYNDDSLKSENLINGITCNHPFDILTTFERRLLVDHNINNKTDQEISESYNVCRATINRRRLKAIEKIKKYYIDKENE